MSAATGGTALQLRILGLAKRVDNEFGTYNKVLVRINLPTETGAAGTTARAGCSAGWGSGSSPMTCWCSAETTRAIVNGASAVALSSTRSTSCWTGARSSRRFVADGAQERRG